MDDIIKRIIAEGASTRPVRLPSRQPQRDYSKSDKTTPTTSILGRGINEETEQEEIVTIGDVERRGGLLLRGNPRTGKTTLLVNMILQDIKNGHGLMFIDPHGDAIDDILKRLPCREEDVIYFDPFDKDFAFGLNLFECDKTDRRQVSGTVNYVLHMFAKLFTEKGDLAKEAPTMDETVQHTGELLIDNQDYLIDGKPLSMTMAEIPWIFNYEDAREKLTPQLTDDHDQAREFWRDYERDKRDEQNEKVASTKRRISKFLSDPHIKHIIGQGTSTIDFRDIIDNKKILLVKLTRDDEQLTNFIGSILIGKLLNTIYADTKPERDRIDFAIYCDEFQNFATPEFAKLFTETGKWHIMPTIANQVGSLLEHTIRGTIATAAIKILYQITEDDASEFAPELAKKPTPGEIRKEPVLAIISDPLGWFRDGKPHRNKRVNELVEKYLTPLLELDSKIENKTKERLNDINTHLRHAMNGELLLTSEKQKDRLLTEMQKHFNLDNIYDMFGWRANSEPTLYIKFSFDFRWALDALSGHFPSEKDTSNAFQNVLYTYQGDGQFLNSARDALIKERYYYRLRERFADKFWIDECSKDEALANLRETYEQHLHSRNLHIAFERAEQKKTFGNMFLPPSISEDIYRLSKFAEPTQRELYSRIRIIYGSGLRNIDNDPVWQKWKGEAEKLASQDVKLVKDFISEWEELGQLLYAEPIMVQTGQYEEKETARRTFADMVEEMKHELVNLPRYTAYCKLVQEMFGKQLVGKYKLHPYPLRQADSEAVVKDRIENIVAQTRMRYCRPRNLVDEEIKARKAALIAHIDRKTKAKTGDDTKVSLPNFTPAQLEKLQTLRTALGEKDYNLFYNDQLVKEKDNRKQLLEKGIDAEQIRRLLEKWRKAGSPSHISPFEELIKTLLG